MNILRGRIDGTHSYYKNNQIETANIAATNQTGNLKLASARNSFHFQLRASPSPLKKLMILADFRCYRQP